MSAVTLMRIDQEKNMLRFYKIDVQSTSFGEYSVVREWGRIGHPGTVRRTPYASVNEAEAARDLRGVSHRLHAPDAARSELEDAGPNEREIGAFLRLLVTE